MLSHIISNKTRTYPHFPLQKAYKSVMITGR